jgi:ABC-type molybdate transport system substrate-binding protein
MKNLIKIAIPAFVLAAAVGMTTMGCGDDTTSTPAQDLSVGAAADLSKTTAPADLSKVVEHD